MNDKQIQAEWLGIAGKQLIGKRITGVRYMTQEEANSLYWSKRPLVITLDDGSWFMPSRDDECNDGGSLITSDQAESVLPVL